MLQPGCTFEFPFATRASNYVSGCPFSLVYISWKKSRFFVLFLMQPRRPLFVALQSDSSCDGKLQLTLNHVKRMLEAAMGAANMSILPGCSMADLQQLYWDDAWHCSGPIVLSLSYLAIANFHDVPSVDAREEAFVAFSAPLVEALLTENSWNSAIYRWHAHRSATQSNHDETSPTHPHKIRTAAPGRRSVRTRQRKSVESNMEDEVGQHQHSACSKSTDEYVGAFVQTMSEVVGCVALAMERRVRLCEDGSLVIEEPPSVGVVMEALNQQKEQQESAQEICQHLSLQRMASGKHRKRSREIPAGTESDGNSLSHHVLWSVGKVRTQTLEHEGLYEELHVCTDAAVSWLSLPVARCAHHLPFLDDEALHALRVVHEACGACLAADGTGGTEGTFRTCPALSILAGAPAAIGGKEQSRRCVGTWVFVHSDGMLVSPRADAFAIAAVREKDGHLFDWEAAPKEGA